MATEPSWQDFYDLFKIALQTRRSSLVVEEGDVTDAIGAGVATVGVAVTASGTAQASELFLDGAEGEALTTLAHDRGVDRSLGTGAVGSITFSRVSTAAGAGTIPAGTRVATQPDATGKFAIFTTDASCVFSGVALSATISATCSSVGKIGNVAAGRITSILDLSTLFDTTLTVSNPDLFAGGTEEESDVSLRDRVRGFFLTQARGTVDALIFGAKSIDGVERVSIVVDDSGVVTAYVSDEDGNSNATMVARVQAELDNNWRAAGDVVYVTGGALQNVSIAVTIVVKVGTDVAALIDRIRDAIVSRLLLLNPGDTLYPDMISAAVRDVDRDSILAVTVTSPLVAITPSANIALRTTTGLVNVN